MREETLGSLSQLNKFTLGKLLVFGAAKNATSTRPRLCCTPGRLLLGVARKAKAVVKNYRGSTSSPSRGPREGESRG